jgi:cytochrome c5
MNQRYFLPALVLGVLFIPLLATVQAHSQTQAQTTAQTGKKQTTAIQGQQHQEEGERIFKQNCSRCHNAPEGFSPNISGTIVRHMRVRASLSRHDEQELLRFFNP